ncbi:MAG TPA: putative glycolipid-binding domain-containing protein [Gemmatimonadaceae bacterium]|nr:putative glycolipid-binding domain-containing protein [Gemmatimonadaceae bacterium]
MAESIEWRRLDLPGREVAQLAKTADGWELSGLSVFTHDARACRLDYHVTCDEQWITQRCTVSGFIGDDAVAVDITRDSAGFWTMNATPVDALTGCTDVDLGFSPSTNLLPIRRLELKIGASAQVRAAWLRFPELELEVLDQVYTRLAHDRYRYVSAGGAFQRDLTVDDRGFVREYPGLWVAEG